MLLERVMQRMETLSLPGRMLQLTNAPNKNGDHLPEPPIRLEDIPEKSNCIC